MKNNREIVKRTFEGKVNTFCFEIRFQKSSPMNYPYVGGYYLAGFPLEEKMSANGENELVELKEFEILELLFEYEEANEEALNVAKKVADFYIDETIIAILQNRKDKEIMEENERLTVEELMKDAINRMGGSTPPPTYFEMSSRGLSEEASQSQDESGDFESVKITLEDVAGLEEVKVELKELIEGFNSKEKFEKFKITPPRGVLLEGDPGNGKSLIARALAGETNAKFISMAGSEFNEKYIGVGAKRVRDLFKKARNNRPCIIFIDEIDAVGSKREEENNKENNATLNQLLVEISSTDNDDILVIGATNRSDILDPALKRQGRLSRHIYIPNPDYKTRLEILELYATNRPLAKDVVLEEISRQTHGMSGADMEAIITEGCMIAIREDRDEVDQNMLMRAIDRQIAGLERKSTVMIEREKEIVSIHEAGHLIASMELGAYKVDKITIVPHERSLGYVLHHEEEDRFISTKEELVNHMKVSLAGAVAEKVFFNHESSGCSGDLEYVTEVARRMVCDYGMSDLGKMFIDYKTPFLQEKIHIEMKEIVEIAEAETHRLITQNKDKIKFVADALRIKETLTGNEIDQLVDEYKKTTCEV